MVVLALGVLHCTAPHLFTLPFFTYVNNHEITAVKKESHVLISENSQLRLHSKINLNYVDFIENPPAHHLRISQHHILYFIASSIQGLVVYLMTLSHKLYNTVRQDYLKDEFGRICCGLFQDNIEALCGGTEGHQKRLIWLMQEIRLWTILVRCKSAGLLTKRVGLCS